MRFRRYILTSRRASPPPGMTSTPFEMTMRFRNTFWPFLFSRPPPPPTPGLSPLRHTHSHNQGRRRKELARSCRCGGDGPTHALPPRRRVVTQPSQLESSPARGRLFFLGRLRRRKRKRNFTCGYWGAAEICLVALPSPGHAVEGRARAGGRSVAVPAAPGGVDRHLCSCRCRNRMVLSLAVDSPRPPTPHLKRTS
jgi:hypothetical protein